MKSWIVSLHLCLLLLGQAFTSSSLEAQSAEGKAAFESVSKYLDSSTVYVAWLDITQLDIEGTIKFMDGVNPTGMSSQNLQRFVAIQEALKSMDVQNIYMVSDFAGLTAGPALVVPSKKPQAVELLLSAAFAQGGQNQIASTEDAVLIGTAASLETLHDADGAAPENLVNAISSVTTPHAAVFATSPEISRTMIQILSSSAKEGDFEEIIRVATALAELQYVTLSLDNLPPEDARLRLASSGSGEEMQKALEAILSKRVPELQASLNIAVDSSGLVVSTDDLQGVLHALVQSSGANRMQRMNDMKQIALALHNFYDAYKHMPPQSLTDKAGKRLLSWRVLILPFLEQQALYEQFHLDEAWDSPHNLKVAAAIPPQYQMRGEAVADENGVPKTSILAPMTENSAFGKPGRPVEFKHITDGTSNTLWFVEARADRAVPWTKPEDLPIDAADPLASICGKELQEFAAALIDGSVHVIEKTVDPKTIHAMITIDGGEVVKFHD